MNLNSTRPAWSLCALAIAIGIALCACSDRGARPTAAGAAAQPNSPHELAMARGKIEVQGGLLEVMAMQDGLVESLAVQEGDAVHRGQVLLKLSTEQARMNIGLAQAELQLVQARQRAQSARLPAAHQLVQRSEEAARAGALDPQHAEDALQAQHEIESAVTVLEAETAVARHKLAQAQWSAQRLALTASVDASVLKLNVQTGARVSTQGTRPVMVLLPRRPLIVRAELNQSYVASVKPGTRASINIDTESPNGTRQGALSAHVVRVSEAFGTSRLDDDASVRANLRVVDCFLEFDNATTGLRLGQDVRVSFHE